MTVVWWDHDRVEAIASGFDPRRLFQVEQQQQMKQIHAYFVLLISPLSLRSLCSEVQSEDELFKPVFCVLGLYVCFFFLKGHSEQSLLPSNTRTCTVQPVYKPPLKDLHIPVHANATSTPTVCYFQHISAVVQRLSSCCCG